MKRIIPTLLVALMLGGCSTQFGERISSVISATQKFSVSQGQLDAARNSYDGTVLAPLAKYAAMPRCKTGQTINLNNPCHDRIILKKLRNADKSVGLAFADTQNMITSGDNNGAVAAYDSLKIAISLATDLIHQSGVSLF